MILPDAPFVKRHYRIAPADIAWLRFVLESYDGLAFVRSLDGRAGLVEVAYPPTRRDDAEALLAELQRTAAMEAIAPPSALDDPL